VQWLVDLTDSDVISCELQGVCVGLWQDAAAEEGGDAEETPAPAWRRHHQRQWRPDRRSNSANDGGRRGTCLESVYSSVAYSTVDFSVIVICARMPWFFISLSSKRFPSYEPPWYNVQPVDINRQRQKNWMSTLVTQWPTLLFACLMVSA